MNELRYRVTELENEKLQYEKKLKCTKVSSDGRVEALVVLMGIDLRLARPCFGSLAKSHRLCCWLDGFLNLSRVLLRSLMAIWLRPA